MNRRQLFTRIAAIAVAPAVAPVEASSSPHAAPLEGAHWSRPPSEYMVYKLEEKTSSTSGHRFDRYAIVHLSETGRIQRLDGDPRVSRVVPPIPLGDLLADHAKTRKIKGQEFVVVVHLIS